MAMFWNSIENFLTEIRPKKQSKIKKFKEKKDGVSIKVKYLTKKDQKI